MRGGVVLTTTANTAWRSARPPESLAKRVERAVGRRGVDWRVPDCGLSSAHRFSVRFDDGSAAFVKAATDAATERWLRTERLVLADVGAAFMPRILGWLDEPGDPPMLLSQDLGHAYWPASHAGVAWRDGQHEALLDGLRAIAATAPPDGLPSLEVDRLDSWAQIARDPTAFLDLGLCSKKWIEAAIDALVFAERELVLAGDALVHGDVRSDNVCFVEGRPLFVDWSNARRGSAECDVAELLPTLHLEGGPRPEAVMPDAGGWPARGSGRLATRLVEEPSLPAWLRAVFQRLFLIELRWSAHALDLAPPDGPGWESI